MNIFRYVDVDFANVLQILHSQSVIDCLRQFYELNDSEKNFSKTMNYHVVNVYKFFQTSQQRLQKEAIMFLEAAAF